MTEQIRGYSYTVVYSRHSSNSSAHHPELCRSFKSAKEAHYYGLQEAIRLASHDSEIKDLSIEEYCLNCDGRGIIYVPYKRIKFKKKETKCPICKSQDSTVKII